MRNRFRPSVGLVAALTLCGLTPAGTQDLQLKDIPMEERLQINAYRVPPRDVAEVPEDAQRTTSGLASRQLTAGHGEEPPGPNDVVQIHYTGWTTKGVVIDSSEGKDNPRNFQVNRAASGFAEGLMLMVEGEKRRLWIPAALAIYRGETPETMVVYDVQMISIVRAPDPPEGIADIPPEAVREESGLAYLMLEPGRGSVHPRVEDSVLMHFNSWTPDGVLTGSSIRRDEPETLPVDQATLGLREALQDMVVGARRLIWVPPELDDANPDLDQTTVWDITILSIFSEPVAPPDVSAVPDDAMRTDSGLAYKVLRPGVGDEHPGLNDTVIVTFSSWNTAGELVDTSYQRSGPVGVTLDASMPAGWTEALISMVVGEKRRLWIPPELGFKGSAEGPNELMVFEVDLLGLE